MQISFLSNHSCSSQFWFIFIPKVRLENAEIQDVFGLPITTGQGGLWDFDNQWRLGRQSETQPVPSLLTLARREQKSIHWAHTKARGTIKEAQKCRHLCV